MSEQNDGKKTNVGVSLDTIVVDKIRQLADADDRSFSGYINIVLKNHVRRVKPKRKIIRPN